ncbi:MAG: DUF993 family protein [Tabrizicola sp.]
MLTLPTADARLEPYRRTGTPLTPRAPRTQLTRTAFAAAHVVSDPLRERNPWDSRPAVDWDATLAFRQQHWDQGLHLAEAMDTAQRGMGVDWPTALELIERTMRAAQAHPMKPRVACAAGTDHATDLTTPDAILAAYTTQAEAIEAAGGQLILMASRASTAIDATQDTYAWVYRRLIDGAARPVTALAGRHVRPGADRLLGQPGHRHRLRFRPQPHRGKPRQSGRHQDLPPRPGA